MLMVLAPRKVTRASPRSPAAASARQSTPRARRTACPPPGPRTLAAPGRRPPAASTPDAARVRSVRSSCSDATVAIEQQRFGEPIAGAHVRVGRQRQGNTRGQQRRQKRRRMKDRHRFEEPLFAMKRRNRISISKPRNVHIAYTCGSGFPAVDMGVFRMSESSSAESRSAPKPNIRTEHPTSGKNLNSFVRYLPEHLRRVERLHARRGQLEGPRPG